MARLHPNSLDLNHFDDKKPWQEAHERTKKELAALEAISEKADPDGDLTGALISFQVADGYAVYLVKKTKPLTLQHVYAHDGYQVSAAHIRGLRLEDVRRQVKADRALESLFAAHKEPREKTGDRKALQ
jgi:hypothetical protein